MNLYRFTTDQFGISESGIHLLRSGYNYKTITFTDTRSITIGKGRQISNWIFALLFGILLISSGLSVLFYACYALYLGKVRVFYPEQFAFAAIPLFIGAYSLFMSLKKGAIIELSTDTGKTSFPIDELRKNGQLESLIYFLESNTLSSAKFRQEMKNRR